MLAAPVATIRESAAQTPFRKDSKAVLPYNSKTALPASPLAPGGLDRPFGKGAPQPPFSRNGRPPLPNPPPEQGRGGLQKTENSSKEGSLSSASPLAPGDLDPTFSGGGKLTDGVSYGTDGGSAVAIQPDGKIVAAGHSKNGFRSDFALVRYNADGSLDTSFDSDGKVTTSIGTSDFASAVAIQPDGKIVAAGNSYNGSDSEFALVRYKPDGSLDTSFDGDGKVTTSI